jgi:Ca2+-binding EF-hand superfamily protein
MAVTNDPKEIFKALDKDKDGYIHTDEMKMSTTYLSQYSSSSSSDFNATLEFTKLDLNNNGFIEATEIDSSLVEGWDNETNSGRLY